MFPYKQVSVYSTTIRELTGAFELAVFLHEALGKLAAQAHLEAQDDLAMSARHARTYLQGDVDYQTNNWVPAVTKEK